MVERNLSLPYKFICFTDNATGLDSSIEIRQLPDIKATGWWYKLSVFNQLPFQGTALFLDLDLIVFKNIDHLFTYKPGSFCSIRDFNRSVSPNYNRINSSVFRFEINSLTHIYNSYIQNSDVITRRFRGDQDYIETQIPNNVFWPDNWIRSYKWEMRDRKSMVQQGNTYTFTKPENPVIFPDTSIAVFHGTPNPHECADTWVKQNWA